MFGWLLLWVLGLGLLFAEVFIPTGGILGLLAIGCAGFGVYQVFQESVSFGLFLVVFSVAYVAWLVFFWLRKVSHQEVLEESETRGTDETIDRLEGEVGEALTILRPTGRGRFGNKVYSVVTQGPFVPRGTRIRVIETSGNRVVVRRLLESEQVPETGKLAHAGESGGAAEPASPIGADPEATEERKE